jgi:hypothetical protein
MPDPRNSDDRSLASRLLTGVKDCFGRIGADREWQSLDGGERRRIAHDLGLNDAELGSFIAESGGSAELDEVLARTELQQTAAMQGALPDLQRVCGLCQHRDECREWLSIPAEARDEMAVPFFCPNREELQVLSEMKDGYSR